MWVDFIAQHASHHPNRPAVVDETGRGTVSYAALDRWASRWAHWLQTAGAVRGDRIALLANNCLEHLTMFFGALRIGALFVPLNFRLAPGELQELCARTEPRFLFTRGDWDLGGQVKPIRLEDHVLPDRTDYRAREYRPDQPMLMLFTSGSTGIPKGVLLHAEMLWWNMVQTHAGWGLRPEDISVVQTPFFHTGGYNVTCLPLLRIGGTLILAGPLDPEHTLRMLERERVTVFFAVPTMLASMAESPNFERADLSHLRFCISGGAPCPRRLMDRYRNRGVMLRQGYGLTEVGPNCFYMFEEDLDQNPDSVGLPMPHTEALLADAEGRPVPDGEVGELCLAGRHVCAGYWRMDDLFKQVYRDGYFHTGDLMRRDARGFFHVVGRIKDMYISGGENVYPGEVVRQILRHPAVIQAEILAVPHARWGEVGFAFLRCTEEIVLEDLRGFLDSRLSRYKHPRYLCRLTSFPSLTNGKVDRAELKKIAERELHGR